MGRTIIVGAGVAGLTLADRLALGGEEVIVLEREGRVGGLARSFHESGFTFDIGPHRFHTYNERVKDFVDSVLEGGIRNIGRDSRVWIFGRLYDWPLDWRSILRLPLPTMASAIVDLLRRSPPAGDSLADHVRHRYGETLYRSFFKPYTERFVQVRCENLSSDWAQTGLERALIDRGIQAGTLLELLRSAFQRSESLEFLYPESGGIGAFAENLERRARAAGALVVTGTEVTAIEEQGDRVSAVQAGSERHACDRLVWTGALTSLAAFLGLEALDLHFLSLVLFNYHVAERCPAPYQWAYFNDPEIPFSRVSIPARFDRAAAPSGATGLCVEVTTRALEGFWQDPSEREPEIRHALLRVGLVNDLDSVRGFSIRKIPEAYPIYTLGYRERVDAVREGLSRWSNLYLLGRGATFWYNNMDHSIGSALVLADRLGPATEAPRGKR